MADTDHSTVRAKRDIVLTLSEEMLDRAVSATYGQQYVESLDHDQLIEKRYEAECVIRAAFEGVPLANYAVGTLLQVCEMVIMVNGPTLGAVVCRREHGRPATEGFETAPHHVDMSWKHEPVRYLSRVTVSKIGAPEVRDVA